MLCTCLCDVYHLQQMLNELVKGLVEEADERIKNKNIPCKN